MLRLCPHWLLSDQGGTWNGFWAGRQELHQQQVLVLIWAFYTCGVTALEELGLRRLCPVVLHFDFCFHSLIFFNSEEIAWDFSNFYPKKQASELPIGSVEGPSLFWVKTACKV